MDNKTIELAGIVRNLPDNRVADGTMQEIINLRPEDGAWRPVGPKESVPMTAADIRYIHTVNEEYKVYWGTPGGSLYYWVYENGIIKATVNTGISLTGKQVSFAQLHKTVMLSNKTDKTMIIFVFDVDTESYRVFNEGFPELPVWAITTESPSLGWPPFVVPTSKSALADTEEGLAWALSIMESQSQYTFTGPIVLRFAWELVDGTIVKQSAPIYVTTSFFSLLSSSEMLWNGRYLKLTMTSSPAIITDILAQWKGVIRSLNIYASRPITPEEGIADILPVFKEPSLNDVLNYYLIKSVPLEASFSVIQYLVDDYREIETFPTIPTDNFSHHTLHANSLFAYNERIFMGDITTRLYNNLSPATFLEPISGGVTGVGYIVVFEVELQTPDGKKTIAYNWSSINYYKSAAEPDVHAFKIKRYLSYPDARATAIRIIIDPVLYGTPKLITTLPLTPNNLLNFAWYNKPSTSDPLTYGEFEFIGPLSGYPDLTAWATIDNTYRDTNRVQLTEQSNPFYYPAINSYRIGNGNVVGMATNAVALSQGQFGQYPVYCFTSDGIWAMTIGTGDPLIQSIVPVSREVCNNLRSITQIDGGVVFTTEKGLYILTGSAPIEISDLAEGNHLSRLTGTVNYEAIANNPNLYQVKSYLCNTNFLSFLSGADIGYDHIHKELVVSNPAKTYSWVYSLRSKMWFKISQSWERFVHDFPRTYGYRTETLEGTTPFYASSTDISASDDTVLASAEYIEGAVYNYLFDLTQEDFADLVPVHMESRPVKISARRFKKIHRLLVGGVVNDSLSNPFSVNLFGSADDRDWFLMNASHAFAAKNRLLIGRTTFSCMYFILVIGGKVDEDAYFTHIEVEFEERYGNKLR